MNDPITPAIIIEFVAWCVGGFAFGFAFNRSREPFPIARSVALAVSLLSVLLAIWVGQ